MIRHHQDIARLLDAIDELGNGGVDSAIDVPYGYPVWGIQGNVLPRPVVVLKPVCDDEDGHQSVPGSARHQITNRLRTQIDHLFREVNSSGGIALAQNAQIRNIEPIGDTLTAQFISQLGWVGEAPAANARGVHPRQHEPVHRICRKGDRHIDDPHLVPCRAKSAPKRLLSPRCASGRSPDPFSSQNRAAKSIDPMLAGVIAGNHRCPGGRTVHVGPSEEGSMGSFGHES